MNTLFKFGTLIYTSSINLPDRSSSCSIVLSEEIVIACCNDSCVVQKEALRKRTEAG